MPSHNSHEAEFNPSDRATLIGLARDSISHGLKAHHPLQVVISDYSEKLQQPRAAFVTLNIHDRLRGCIGHLEAIQPLVKDIADNAYAAAFQDPRFPPVTANELPLITIHLSVLTAAKPLTFGSEEELLNLLQPGTDGLILEEGHHRGTFLPSVWEQLPEPKEFLRHLKNKAGLAGDYWSDSLRLSRYTTESFS
ncbi:MAG: AmmeMemoRadiSam system protein A [Sedimenticola sp.]|nr:AmmeMemoRadiSam system protein A [Sedimenticola sp.]